jgi:hypothetical protein
MNLKTILYFLLKTNFPIACLIQLFLVQVFRAKDLMDNNLALIKNTLSGAIIDPDRLVLGTDEGLFCLDLDRTGKFSFKASKHNTELIL